MTAFSRRGSRTSRQDQPRTSLDALAARLRELQNADGGWGATANRPSNTEATALCVLAFADDDGLRTRAAAWLVEHQRQDGSWPWTEEVDKPSWASSQAVLALADIDRESDAVKLGVAWLLGQEGRGYDWRYRLREFISGKRNVDLDATLKGWPWAPDTFSWIEPTAFALLALKSAVPEHRSRHARSRITEGEKMILDRECPGGGWNYGNGRVLGMDLEPYPDTTALALLALQGAGGVEIRRRNLDVLDRLVDATESGLVFSLAALCRQAYGLDASDLLARAEEKFAATGFLDETRAIALTVVAARHPHLFRLADD